MVQLNKNTIRNIQFPSNHLFVSGIKILLVGNSEEWMDLIINSFDHYWTSESINFFFVREKQFTFDEVSWILSNENNVDFIIVHLQKEMSVEQSFFVGNFIKNPKTFFSSTESLENSFFSLLEDISYKDSSNLVLDIRNQWNK